MSDFKTMKYLSILLLLFRVVLSSRLLDTQEVLKSSAAPEKIANDIDTDAISLALKNYADPVDALVSLQPGLEIELQQPRLLQVFGEQKSQWMTEGDKLRLHRLGKQFMDLTDHQEFYEQNVDTLAGKATLPNMTHQNLIRPLFSGISTERMHDVLQHMTSYYNRYYGGVIGEYSAVWLHDYIAKIIRESPFHTHISLEYHTHPFPQPSVIARFEPKVRNFSLPLTILGAHQDSANYNFPLLPAPGADDDCSGTVSILEAFRVLAHAGYVPKNGPVEFHWYAAEEGGLLGSQAIARFKKEQHATIGAMIQFDMTAYIARNSTEKMSFLKTEADKSLTDWVLDLSKEYIDLPSGIYELPMGGSDHMSFTKMKYPAAFATEGNPMGNSGKMPGDFDPHIHGSEDTMDIDDAAGIFSIDHMARFSELAIAFAVEQAGWDNAWR
ncbi:Zn-dependent exopeptidase [Microthyrium microscopicum]|uniref:Peptide hydrolase n=1 Tax=Microthyrium microscopicum TaxID=703497 RepID=A0A6A6UB58_9PEZI|nr:Zn-dependent exopeptidase [Microthyrium microscopicum]